MRATGRLVALAACAALVVASAPTAWAATPGPAYSWGSNEDGRLGLGAAGNRWVPTPIGAPGEFVSITSSGNFGCGLDSSGEAWCWGSNGEGRLGNGSTTTSPTPVSVLGDRSYNAIDSGRDSNCAITDDTIWCWGKNDSGQLGNGTTTDDSAPMEVLEASIPLTSIHSISVGGSSACAVTNIDDSAYCWGNNEYGHLGNGQRPADSSMPVPVSGHYRFVEVSVGGEFSCGVTRVSGDTGLGVCWGLNHFAQLGKGTISFNAADDSVPQPVTGGLMLRSISAGDAHACAIGTDDSVYCWGQNSNGKAGVDPNIDPVMTPTRVTIPRDAPVRDVSAGSSSTCAITDDTAYCWGSGWRGQLGNGLDASSAVPVPVSLAGIDPQASPVQVTSGEDFNTFIVKTRMTFDDTAFQSVQVGQSTATTVSVDNNWPRDMSVTGVSVAGSGVAIGGTTCSGVLTPTSPCTVTLLWSPSAAGPLSATLTVSYVGNSSSTPLTGMASPLPPPIVSSPPRDVSASAGIASAAVTWTAPTSPGSYPVTTYQVTSAPGGHTCLTSAITCTVTGLTNGTTYTFTVKALSGAGWGETSAPSNAVTPRAAPSPTITITGSRDGQRITVTGTAMHLDSEAVRPWFRFPGQTTFTEGSAVIPIAADGSFTWSRRSGKKTYVYVAHESTRSNTVTIPAR